MAYSANGINWTAVPDSTFGNNEITSIAWGNNKFVAGGRNGKWAYSADGINWIRGENSIFDVSGYLDSNTISNIAWGANKFIAGSRDGRMAYWSGN
jgi:hypothetical protein